MPSKQRLLRIADRIQEELSEMLIKDVKDPRIGQVFITHVKVDRELAFADIYVSSIEGISKSSAVILGLNHAKGFFRSNLAKQINLRASPQLRFHWDPTPENAEHIEKLLESIRQNNGDPE